MIQHFYRSMLMGKLRTRSSARAFTVTDSVILKCLR